MKPKDLAIIYRTNADDVRCVSWVLRNITDPEALDAAIRLAGTIRWFYGGINVDPPDRGPATTVGTANTRSGQSGVIVRGVNTGNKLIYMFAGNKVGTPSTPLDNATLHPCVVEKKNLFERSPRLGRGMYPPFWRSEKRTDGITRWYMFV